jgi:hypothetical protein
MTGTDHRADPRAFLALLPFVKEFGIRVVTAVPGQVAVRMHFVERFSTPPNHFPASIVGVLGDVAAAASCISLFARWLDWSDARLHDQDDRPSARRGPARARTRASSWANSFRGQCRRLYRFGWARDPLWGCPRNHSEFRDQSLAFRTGNLDHEPPTISTGPADPPRLGAMNTAPLNHVLDPRFLYGIVLLSALGHALWNAMLKRSSDRLL